MIIYQGGEGGGHTGDVPTSILGPRVVDLCRGHKSPLTGKPIVTIAAGGIYRGKSLAAALCYGSDGVWCVVSWPRGPGAEKLTLALQGRHALRGVRGERCAAEAQGGRAHLHAR
jgi:hypothetical protein